MSNFSFQTKTSLNNQTRERGLTAQEEYWLNRILRDHGWQIFVVTVLMIIMIITAIVVSPKEENNRGGIEIKNGGMTININN